MVATKDVTALFNGSSYAFKAGENVEAPAPLVRKLKEQGLVKAARKKEPKND